MIAFGANNTGGPIDQAAALNANRGCHNPGDFEAGTLLLQAAGAICAHSFVGGAGGRPEGATQGHFVPVAFQSKQSASAQAPSFDDVAPTLDVAKAGGMATLTATQVRRLTPVECERLQGFPDNYTAIPWRKKPADQCPDGPRYKALGNSWAVPVVRWIGQRIQYATWGLL